MASEIRVTSAQLTSKKEELSSKLAAEFFFSYIVSYTTLMYLYFYGNR